MHKEKNSDFGKLEKNLRTVHFLWQSSPDSDQMAMAMKGLIKEAASMKVQLIFKVKNQIFENGESSRAITRTDIESVAKREGDEWVFHLAPKRSVAGRFIVTVEDLYGREDRGILDTYNFVIKEKLGDSYTTIGIFRPHEIASISIL